MTNIYGVPTSFNWYYTLTYLGYTESIDYTSAVSPGLPSPIGDINDHSGYDTLIWINIPITWSTILANWEDASVYYFQGADPQGYINYQNTYFFAQKQDLASSLTQVSGISSLSSDVLALLGASSNSAIAGNMDLATASITDFVSAVNDIIAAKSAANSGLATLDSSGKVPTTQLPALAIGTITPVASQVAQLALTAQSGDVAVRTDTSTTYMHNSGTTGTMSDWTQILSPTSGVSSFNTRTGAVSPTTGDYAASNVTNDSSVSGSAVKDALNALLTAIGAATSSFTPSLVSTGATGSQVTKRTILRGTFSTQFTWSLSGNPSSIVTMKICSTNDATEANWTTVGSTGFTQAGGLAVTVGQQISQTGQICGDVPAGWYYKFVNTGVGTHTEGVVSGQKTIYG